MGARSAPAAAHTKETKQIEIGVKLQPAKLFSKLELHVGGEAE
jgi:hypothetical protein